MTTPGQSKGSRVVAAVNLGIVAVLVVIVGSVALVVSPPAPPGIAEFAPEASKAIVKAPLAQSAVLGAGPSGACAAGQSCAGAAKKTPSAKPTPSTTRASATPSATSAASAPPSAKASSPASASPSAKATMPAPSPSASTIAQGVPSSLQCYEWPDGSVTQTSDPQSPPCIATYDVKTGNGGATSTGVTGNEIDVAVPNGSVSGVADMFAFLNTHFEFYGRQLKLIDIEPTGNGEMDPSEQHATAAQVASMNVFATTGLSVDGDDDDYLDGVTASKIVYVGEDVGVKTAADFQADAPYAWSYGPPVDVTERNAAQFYCNSLKGKNATYGGTAGIAKVRKAAILYPDSGTYVPAPYTALADELSACGVTAEAVQYTNMGSSATGNNANTQLMLNLQQGGYTTLIVPASLPDDVESLQTTAQNLNYQPEWMLPGLGGQYTEIRGIGDTVQAEHSFGLAVTNKDLPLAESPWYQAVKSADPTFQLPAGTVANFSNSIYHQLLLLASGIQLAGPKLTPATFSSGLQGATFPNPEAAQDPSYQGTVNFGAGHAMISDTGVWWQSPTESDATTGAGASSTGYEGGLCWVQRGARWKLGAWPSNLVVQDTATCR